MSDNKPGKKTIILAITAVASLMVLIFTIIRLIGYSSDVYNSGLNHKELRELVGESSLSLYVDEETGRPLARRTVLTPTPSEESAQEPVQKVLDKYRKLYDINSDMVGWISIEDTNIDYPVMQTVYDEEFYLHRNFNKEEDREGLPFVDFRSEIKDRTTNLIIYGHNMKNGDMFHDLLLYEDSSFLDNHRYIRFDTVYEEGLYEIISVFRTHVSYLGEDTFKFYNFIEADDANDFYEYLRNISALNIYEIDTRAQLSDELITLSTCEYSEEDGRFVVVARRISEED